MQARDSFREVWHRNCPIIGHVLILAVDTSSPSGSLAVLRDENLAGVVAVTSSEIYSSRVFRHLDFLLGELALHLEDFDLFAVAAGPGSFTGLRVGLAAVKGWAEVFQKPVAAISVLEALAAQARSRSSQVVPVLDARRNERYWGFYRRQDSDSGEKLALENNEMAGTSERLIQSLLNSSGEELEIVTISAEISAELTAQLARSNPNARRFAVSRAWPTLAPEIAYLGGVRAREGTLADPLTLDANYIRRSDAELHWKRPAGT